MRAEWMLCPLKIVEAPELAALAALDGTLEATVSAMLAAHSHLDCAPDYPDARWSPHVHIAGAITTMANGLRELLDAYVRLMQEEESRRLTERASDGEDDIPF